MRVGGTFDGRVTQFFDEGSVTLVDGKASVWRLYVTGSPRLIGRMMTQAVWTLSDYDCAGQTVASRLVGPARHGAGGGGARQIDRGVEPL